MKMSWRVRTIFVFVLVVSSVMTLLMIQDFRQAAARHRVLERDINCRSSPVLGRRGDMQDVRQSDVFIYSVFNNNNNNGDHKVDGDKNDNTMRSNNVVLKDSMFKKGINNDAFDDATEEAQELEFNGNLENRESSETLDNIKENLGPVGIMDTGQASLQNNLNRIDSTNGDAGTIRENPGMSAAVQPAGDKGESKSDTHDAAGDPNGVAAAADRPAPVVAEVPALDAVNNRAAGAPLHAGPNVAAANIPIPAEPNAAAVVDANAPDPNAAIAAGVPVPAAVNVPAAHAPALVAGNIAIENVALPAAVTTAAVAKAPVDVPAVAPAESDKSGTSLNSATTANTSGEEDVCKLLEKRTEHLSPLATINRRIMVADPPLTRQQISEVYHKACGLTQARAPDGQLSWKEGGILYIPKNITGEKRFGKVTVYNADFEPYVPYNHTLFFEGRKHPRMWYKDRKVILARMSGWDDVTKPRPLRACPDLPCLISTDWKKYSRTAAAVSFNGQLLKGKAPRRHRPDQVFIMYFYEPLTNPWPAYSYLKNPKNGWASVFNWTMTYHITSDILATYGMVRRRPQALAAKNYTEIVSRKTKKVAWFVSHCHTESKREQYVAELQKYIPVDIYGACGPFKCRKEVDTTCFSQVGRDYKFYLAFENAMCEDYTTEKLYRIFKADAVVVSRGNSYNFRSLPSDTFIDASEFPSPRALADRLLYLDAHDEEYTALLQRKDEFFASYQDYPHYVGKYKQLWVKYTWENIPLCEVCQRIWNLDKYHKSYPDILGWLNERKCKAPTDL